MKARAENAIKGLNEHKEHFEKLLRAETNATNKETLTEKINQMIVGIAFLQKLKDAEIVSEEEKSKVASIEKYLAETKLEPPKKPRRPLDLKEDEEEEVEEKKDTEEEELLVISSPGTEVKLDLGVRIRNFFRNIANKITEPFSKLTSKQGLFSKKKVEPLVLPDEKKPEEKPKAKVPEKPTSTKLTEKLQSTAEFNILGNVKTVDDVKTVVNLQYQIKPPALAQKKTRNQNLIEFVMHAEASEEFKEGIKFTGTAKTVRDAYEILKALKPDYAKPVYFDVISPKLKFKSTDADFNQKLDSISKGPVLTLETITKICNESLADVRAFENPKERILEQYESTHRPKSPPL